jgi:hypothetical protein
MQPSVSLHIAQPGSSSSHVLHFVVPLSRKPVSHFMQCVSLAHVMHPLMHLEQLPDGPRKNPIMHLSQINGDAHFSHMGIVEGQLTHDVVEG